MNKIVQEYHISLNICRVVELMKLYKHLPTQSIADDSLNHLCSSMEMNGSDASNHTTIPLSGESEWDVDGAPVGLELDGARLSSSIDINNMLDKMRDRAQRLHSQVRISCEPYEYGHYKYIN